jgi:pimeloyl-ACP methyl ester carboxylesterase
LPEVDESISTLVEGPGGRQLAVDQIGEPDGLAVLAHVGTPNSRRLYGVTVAEAVARGLRLISYDRPGYGESTPQPGRTMADTVADVRAICTALGVERFATWGVSGGGPSALACAALLPDLVTAAASLASLAPYDATGLDWMAGFSDGAVEEVRLMQTDPDASREAFERERARMLAATAEEYADELRGTEDPGLDDGALLAEAGSMQAAVRVSIEGSWDDCISHLAPWGFDVSVIAVPVLLLHGTADTAVPVAHGRWLASRIPGVDARILDGEAHGVRSRHIGEVYDWLVEHS